MESLERFGARRGPEHLAAELTENLGERPGGRRLGIDEQRDDRTLVHEPLFEQGKYQRELRFPSPRFPCIFCGVAAFAWLDGMAGIYQPRRSPLASGV